MLRQGERVKGKGESREVDRSNERLPASPRSFLYHRNEGGRERGPKVRIERNARSWTGALGDRRLNSLYRKIIANENIGCAGIQIAAARTNRAIGDLSMRFVGREGEERKNVPWSSAPIHHRCRRIVSFVPLSRRIETSAD